MKSLGQQFSDKMMPRIEEKFFNKATETLAEDMIEDARTRSADGQALPQAKWNNRYERTQAKKHGRTKPVTLRDTGASMKGMRSNKAARGAAIHGSQKLRWHDTGTAKGGKTRQLFPKTLEQFPAQLLSQYIKSIKRILDGQPTT